MQDSSLNLSIIIEQVCKEKGFQREVMIEALEEAILTAAKKTLGEERDLEARYNPETGTVELYQFMTVVEEVENPYREITLEEAKAYGFNVSIGEQLGFQIYYREEDSEKAKEQDKKYGKLLKLKTYKKALGRIAAQVAKQIIFQKLKDAERENIYREFKDRVGELVNGVVRRFEKGDIIVDLGKTEAILPLKEQVPTEHFRAGDRIVAYIKEINKGAKGGHIIILSRKDPNFIVRLFENTIPEIHEGIVRIVSVARDPGLRTKIAVSSKDLDIDPVGACVGMKGNRVQTIVQELKGEKIDIIPWDKDPAKFVCNAISPAEVLRVIIDEDNGSMDIVVPDDKLSIAIGKKGQNIMLASQLTGWKLNVMSESKYQELAKKTIETLSKIEGINEQLATTLYKLGFRSIEELAEADETELAGIPDMGGLEVARNIKQGAQRYLEEKYKTLIAEVYSKKEVTDYDRWKLVRNLGEKIIGILRKNGYEKVEDVVNVAPEELAVKTGLGLKKAKTIIESAKKYLELEKKVLESLKK